jgi:hypothetical protein
MRQKLYGNLYRTTIVCVDSYERSVLTGRLYNPYLSAGIRFDSTMELLGVMEQMLDRMQLPQAFTTVRSFDAGGPSRMQIRETEAEGGSEHRKGRQATFAVRILFRRNTSWQGSVQWLEEKKDESFRSAMELLLLLDSALRKQGSNETAI